MIIKRFSRKKHRPFPVFARYITAKAGYVEGILYLKATNCGVDDPTLAVKVITATQSLSTRTKKDKSYHAMVSFPLCEEPTVSQLIDIEQTICERLGFGDHQRMSAGDNTDATHLRLHIAVSRVNTETLKVVDPYRDFYILDEACRDLELRHGLQRDNRINWG